MEKLQQLKKDFEEGKHEGYREKIAECDQKIALADKLNARAKRKRKILLALAAAAVVLAVATPTVILPTINYNIAVKMMKEGSYDEAIEAFQALDGFMDSKSKVNEATYNKAVSFREEGHYNEALELFRQLGDFKDSQNQINETKYDKAVSFMEKNRYDSRVFIIHGGNSIKLLFEDHNDRSISARIICTQADLKKWKQLIIEAKGIINREINIGQQS